MHVWDTELAQLIMYHDLQGRVQADLGRNVASCTHRVRANELQREYSDRQLPSFMRPPAPVLAPLYDKSCAGMIFGGWYSNYPDGFHRGVKLHTTDRHSPGVGWSPFYTITPYDGR